ncbi:MAG: YbaN family protein [Candidatus Caldatribacteriota bacterium]
MRSINIRKTSNKIVRGTLIVLGTVFVGFGVVGIFLPILPTTPFFLLAAASYARSSERFYYWILHNRWFGNYIKNYREGKGISLTVKLWTIFALWFTILLSVFIVDDYYVKVLLLFIAAAVTLHIVTIKTFKS